MSEIVCQVGNQAGQVEFIWSSRGGFFRPYVVAGTQLTELRQAADQTRVALEALVFALNQSEESTPWEPSYALAESGSKLFNCLLPNEDETAGKVLRWLKDLRKQSGPIGLEVVVDERSTDPGTFLSIPWNLVYDEPPEDYEPDFQAGEGEERWRPFWAIRYNLTTGRRVDPLKRSPIWSDPRVIVVIDPTVYETLHEEQKRRLDEFLAEARLTRAGSLRELRAALRAGFPRLLYWLGHATPEFLRLGPAEKILPSDLRNLLRNAGSDGRERPEGTLAFLNACQTAEAGSTESFLNVLHSFGFTGAIATERQTIDNFANEFGLAFLRGFLREGKPLGELLHSLRLERAPLGLIYGAHCPPEIRVRRADEVTAPVLPEIREVGRVAGAPLSAAVLEVEARTSTTPARLPDEPYRSLAYYDEPDRALFTGRDADVVRFAATLDLPDTRIMVLHGESGIGKSSFLRAGVIPYLEEECVGYRFFRRPDGAVLIVQAAKDLVGQLAQALLDATTTPLRYDTPDGEPLVVNLRRVLDEALGTTADYATLREALRRDPHLLADVLARMAGRLPHALVLVLDQAEEVFTLARTPEEVAGRDHGLRMLQGLVDVTADVKLIVSLRTEYYGRLLDHLRAGRRDLTGVRDDLLRDFSRSALIEAITRPTSETPLSSGQPSPRERYGFHYAEGIPEQIADGVLALRSENQDSVLPLVQVICTQLYEREKTLPGSDGVITREDLDAIKGVEGGLKAFAEDALVRSMRLGPEDREAFKDLFSQLYNRQPDGTLTTWLMPRESLEAQWDRRTSFADVLEAAKSARLLREDELRIEGGEPRRYIRLGHDALAKVAADWDEELKRRARLKKFSLALAVSLAVAVGMGGLAVWAVVQRDRARKSKAEATVRFRQAKDAVDELVQAVARQLKNVPGTQDVRTALLEEAARKYEVFAKAASNDPELRSAMAEASYQLGEILSEIGKRDDAIQNYSRAITAFRELLGLHPALPAYREGLARALFRRGYCKFYIKAEDTYWRGEMQEAAEIYAKLTADAPVNADHRFGVVRVNFYMGEHIFDSSRYDEALRLFEVASARANLIPIGGLADAERQEFVAIAVEVDGYIGLLKRLSRDVRQAVVALHKADTLARLTIESFPNYNRLRTSHGWVLMELGIVNSLLGESTNAASCFDQAIMQLEFAARLDPSVPANMKMIGHAKLNYANFLFQRARYDEADRIALEAKDAVDSALSMERDRSFFLYFRACVQILRSRIMETIGNPEESGRCLDQGIEGLEEVVRKDPGKEVFRGALAIALRDSARRMVSQGRPREAVGRFLEAIRLLSQPTPIRDESLNYDIDLIGDDGFSFDKLTREAQGFRETLPASVTPRSQQQEP